MKDTTSPRARRARHAQVLRHITWAHLYSASRNLSRYMQRGQPTPQGSAAVIKGLRNRIDDLSNAVDRFETAGKGQS
jgi:hypothetical protein